MRNDLDHKSWVCPEEKETPFSGEDMNKKSFLTCQCFNSSTKVRCLEKLPTYFLPQSTLSMLWVVHQHRLASFMMYYIYNILITLEGEDMNKKSRRKVEKRIT